MNADQIHDRDAEAAVLGAILLGPDGLGEGLDLLEEEMFTTPKHRAVFAACRELYEAQEPIDSVSVAGALQRTDRLDAAGGPGAVAMLIRHAMSSANWLYHVRRVIDRDVARSVSANAAAVLRFDYTDPGPELAEQARFVFETVDTHAPHQPLPAVIPERWRKRVEERKRGRVGMQIGMRPLDRALGYIRYGECIVVAGRPGSGKTSLCNTISAALGARGVPVGVLTLEQTLADWEDRTIAQISEVPLELIQARDDLCGTKISEAQDHAADKAAEAINRWPIRVLYLSQPTPVQCRAALAALVRDGARFLLLDHLRQIDYQVGPKEKSHEKIGQAIDDFRQRTAQRYGVPLMLFQQMNREIEGKRRRPNLGDLRDSGKIEEVADRVLFVHDDGEADERELIVAKARGKTPPPVVIGFDKHTTRFFDHNDGTSAVERGTASLDF